MRRAVTVIVHDYRGVGTRHDIMTFLPEEPHVRLLNGEIRLMNWKQWMNLSNRLQQPL